VFDNESISSEHPLNYYFVHEEAKITGIKWAFAAFTTR
jgi:hypothetical protein